MENNRTYTAFAGNRLIASGSLRTTVLRTKECLDQGETAEILVFDDYTGRQVDFDLHGTLDEVLARLASHPLFASSEAPSSPRAGPGRPKLGVVCREVSLLPRHWEWLEQQPHGISAALRRLVEEARKHEPGKERARLAREAAGKFMWAMAGNLPGFEEAARALFAKEQERFLGLIHDWPDDIRVHLCRLVEQAVQLEAAGTSGGKC